jgi:hypothetical protein
MDVSTWLEPWLFCKKKDNNKRHTVCSRGVFPWMLDHGKSIWQQLRVYKMRRFHRHDNGLFALTVITSSIFPMASKIEHTSNSYRINIVVSWHRSNDILCMPYHEELSATGRVGRLVQWHERSWIIWVGFHVHPSNYCTSYLSGSQQVTSSWHYYYLMCFWRRMRNLLEIYLEVRNYKVLNTQYFLAGGVGEPFSEFRCCQHWWCSCCCKSMITPTRILFCFSFVLSAMCIRDIRICSKHYVIADTRCNWYLLNINIFPLSKKYLIY